MFYPVIHVIFELLSRTRAYQISFEPSFKLGIYASSNLDLKAFSSVQLDYMRQLIMTSFLLGLHGLLVLSSNNRIYVPDKNSVGKITNKLVGSLACI